MIVVSTELTDHVHLHGYDLMADVGPGSPRRSGSRPTRRAGSRSSSRSTALPIAELEVRP